MSPDQTKAYWRAWTAAVRAHNWRGSGEALASTRQECWVSPELNRDYQAVWDAASGIAWQAGRCSLSADDLRHACHCVATGHNASSKHFTNSEFDHVLALLRLLADPENLDNVRAWQDREAGERRRHVHVIAQADTAYWSKVASGKFGTADLDRLSLGQLRQLSLTIRNRLAAKSRVAVPHSTLCPA